MTTERWPSDFLEQMYWLVVECSRLFEFPVSGTDYVQGEIIEHGPWMPAECSATLVRWFDSGLIELYPEKARPPYWRGTPEQWQEVRSPGWNSPLDCAEARALLATPTRWTFESDDGFVEVCRTDAGTTAPPEAWITAAP